ncbi:MAG: HlyD family efflux transporter periplasmic adaptor subunit [Candidatus Competibacteraceae bacterium]
MELETGVQAAEADRDVAQAQRAVAARNVEKCRIAAPFAGVVLERQAQVGALAAPGTTLLRLVDLAPPEIEAQVQAAQADGLLQAREPVFDSQGRRYPARLLRLSPVVDLSPRALGSPGWRSSDQPRPQAAAASCAGEHQHATPR